jgi:hypothetical protein
VKFGNFNNSAVNKKNFMVEKKSIDENSSRSGLFKGSKRNTSKQFATISRERKNISDIFEDDDIRWNHLNCSMIKSAMLMARLYDWGMQQIIWNSLSRIELAKISQAN